MSRATQVVTPEVVAAFRQSGAVPLRALLTPSEIDVLREGIERNLANPTDKALVASAPSDPGRFFEDFRMYPAIEEYVATVERTAVGEAAALLMGSEVVRFHHDHLLVKEASTQQETPWHQDLPYYNITGLDNVSFWIPVDPVPMENSLRFLAGSHRSGQMYCPRTFLTNEAKWWPEGTLPELSELFQSEPRPKTLQWELVPGDAIAFHMLSVHSAGGAHHAHRRRAYSIRVVGGSARHAARPWRTSPPFEDLGSELADGAPFDHPLFPILWPPKDMAYSQRHKRIGGHSHL